MNCPTQTPHLSSAGRSRRRPLCCCEISRSFHRFRGRIARLRRRRAYSMWGSSTSFAGYYQPCNKAGNAAYWCIFSLDPSNRRGRRESPPLRRGSRSPLLRRPAVDPLPLAVVIPDCSRVFTRVNIAAQCARFMRTTTSISSSLALSFLLRTCSARAASAAQVSASSAYRPQQRRPDRAPPPRGPGERQRSPLSGPPPRRVLLARTGWQS
ncbi:Hypothetical protein NGAL_HAMBI490_28230 [Neorhizobium galegae bv. officinalis]|nr:Hypothetical protein NGAL_HAMBI490_28230 [Neorhizobium galegae bv. officinalis]